MFPDMVGKLPNLEDQLPLHIESAVVRQLPHDSKFMLPFGQDAGFWDRIASFGQRTDLLVEFEISPNIPSFGGVNVVNVGAVLARLSQLTGHSALDTSNCEPRTNNRLTFADTEVRESELAFVNRGRVA
jgi:hypothetical protein